MTKYLLATASVHVTAGVADYLADHLDPSNVEVVVVREGAPDRDAGDAANVARSRLAVAGPEIDLREGEPTDELLAAVEECEPDVLLIGRNDGSSEEREVGATVTALLESVSVPVVVVPVTTRE